MSGISKLSILASSLSTSANKPVASLGSSPSTLAEPTKFSKAVIFLSSASLTVSSPAISALIVSISPSTPSPGTTVSPSPCSETLPKTSVTFLISASV